MIMIIQYSVTPLSSVWCCIVTDTVTVTYYTYSLHSHLHNLQLQLTVTVTVVTVVTVTVFGFGGGCTLLSCVVPKQGVFIIILLF